MVLESDQSPTVSVVLCTRERAPDLTVNLPAVVKSCEAAAFPCEIVVVDNAPSSSSTREVVSSHPVRYVVEPHKGLGAARNCGVAHSAGTVVLFVDDDVEVPPEWVTTMSAPILAGTCDLVAGAVVPGPGRLQDWMGPHFRASLTIAPQDGEPSHLIGASFAVHGRVFKSVKFDPRLGAGSAYGSAEDVFFYEQAKEAGYRVLGCSGAPAVHNFDLARMRYEALCRTAKGVGRSEAFIAHHWLHSDLSWLRLRLVVDWVRLRLARRPFPRRIGITDREFRRRAAFACKMQLLEEQGVPRRYDYRGLAPVR